MKKFFVLTVLSALCMPLFAQLRLGILAGPHSASVQESNQLPGWDTATSPFYSNRSGFHAGFLAEMPIGTQGHWYFQPGLMYMSKGRKYFRAYDSAAAQATDTVSVGHNFFVNYIEMPLNLAYKIRLSRKTSFVLSAGPYLSFFYNGTLSTESRTFTDNTYSKDEANLEVGRAANKVKTLDLGWNARAGFDFGTVFLTGFFSQGLSSFYQADYSGNFHHRVMGASLGFWLNKTAPLVPKPKDKDKDGIPDEQDACPLVAGVASAAGCPDKDGDGVADQVDQCPDTAGLARYKGCPIPDSDGDGINDEMDKCPQQAGLQRYQGCPIPDRDGDGINDEEDKCPDSAGVAAYQGCPIPDSDGDGINDQEDKCPNQPGTAENKGCPVLKKEIVERVNYAARNIFFAPNSDRLEKRSFGSLDEVAAILQANPALKLFIDGHTDNTGSADYNLKLSQRRAEAVQQYLLQKGIEAARLQATGYGQEKPVGDNSTAAGRKQNRRVELRLEYQ